MASSSTQEPPPAYSKHDPTPHKTRNGIPPDRRRSMEDESRELPTGWVRTYDPNSNHQFFVDTRSDPPRSIWHHPYDDEQYMSSLPSAERERIQTLHRVPTDADVVAETSDDDELPPRGPPKREDSHPGGVKRFGRKVKDKMTSSTHQEREAQRAKRAQEERQAYERHMALRRAMQRSIQTGEPQLIGKDRDGQDVYISPPQGMRGQQYANSRYINPYGSGAGMYASPGMGYMQPGMPYRRPYGYGYGGGLGLPLMGGLGGGLLLGSALGGGLFF